MEEFLLVFKYVVSFFIVHIHIYIYIYTYTFEYVWSGYSLSIRIIVTDTIIFYVSRSFWKGARSSQPHWKSIKWRTHRFTYMCKWLNFSMNVRKPCTYNSLNFHLTLYLYLLKHQSTEVFDSSKVGLPNSWKKWNSMEIRTTTLDILFGAKIVGQDSWSQDSLEPK